MRKCSSKRSSSSSSSSKNSKNSKNSKSSGKDKKPSARKFLSALKHDTADVIAAWLGRADCDPDDAEVFAAAGKQPQTPLIWASRHGSLKSIQALLLAGACVDATTSQGATALYIAAQQGNDSAVRLLVEQGGADLSLARATGASPLFIAAQASVPPRGSGGEGRRLTAAGHRGACLRASALCAQLPCTHPPSACSATLFPLPRAAH